jgi:peptidoglycan hydrolase-like protein with peptidoglycan-binding domain
MRRGKAAALPCGDYMAFQVLLDRQGFSPGQIDGRPGANFTHALAAFRNAKKLTAAPQPDCDTWKALEGESTEATTTYTITDTDVKGPFEESIPRNLVEQSKLPALAYQSPAEAHQRALPRVAGAAAAPEPRNDLHRRANDQGART